MIEAIKIPIYPPFAKGEKRGIDNIGSYSVFLA
jgi:hypothetical protein